jgi:hypothetical protein
MRAACAIAAAASGSGNAAQLLSRAERDATWIERDVRYTPIMTRALARMLRAGVAATRGNPATALDLLDGAIAGFREGHSVLWLAIASRLRGELLGGEEGGAMVRESDAWMAGEGIVNPARLAAAYAPGFHT